MDEFIEALTVALGPGARLVHVVCDAAASPCRVCGGRLGDHSVDRMRKCWLALRARWN